MEVGLCGRPIHRHNRFPTTRPQQKLKARAGVLAIDSGPQAPSRHRPGPRLPCDEASGRTQRHAPCQLATAPPLSEQHRNRASSGPPHQRPDDRPLGCRSNIASSSENANGNERVPTYARGTANTSVMLSRMLAISIVVMGLLAAGGSIFAMLRDMPPPNEDWRRVSHAGVRIPCPSGAIQAMN